MGALHGSPRAPERLLLKGGGVQRLLKRQVEMHWPGPAMGVMPCLLRQALKFNV